MRETWKECVGFPNYQISNIGRIRNKDKIMKPHNRWDGYYHIGLWGEDGKRHYPVIHRLVALAFLPNPQNLPLINHKDENRHNNRLDNLEWCDSSYNIRYSLRRRKYGRKRIIKPNEVLIIKRVI